MKASEYKGYYNNLKVHLGDGTTTTVDIKKYRLGKPVNESVRKQLMDKVAGGITDFEVQVGLGDDLKAVDDKFLKSQAFHVILASPFTGKGAPEHCQAVLQLVKHFWPTTDLQKYADENLGLDCNGFVGNYLRHGWRTADWSDHGRSDKHLDNPDMRIDGFFDSRTKNRVQNWSDINPANLYLFIRTKDTGDIIVASTGTEIGHIVISDVGSPALAPTTAGGKPGITVVESTASHSPAGLSVNSYSWAAEKKAGTRQAIFKVDRGPGIIMHKQIWFMIVRVDPPPTPKP